ncbi:hypothetical protein VPNG_10222 [Cytospora leucostoma]|uniref:Velvet domain-containing protein n=1 Tax=Cytospora leucostoma TaxID=1230097 RepID=A0A423VCM1_9PEZI|nr:hypothetical protein VPNG_10222 [Cytospora leucostoma]
MTSSAQQVVEVSVEIVVQPPLRVGVSRWLIPPVVARTSNPGLVQEFADNRKHVYATAMLTSSDGEDYSTILNGNWNVNANLVADSGGSGSGGGSSSRHARNRWLYFVFHPVSIGLGGTFSFSVVVSALSLESNSCMVVGGRSTRQFTVVNQPVPPEKPRMNDTFCAT